MFLPSFIFGRLSAQVNTPSFYKIDDDCKYSCKWWIERLGVNCSKQKIFTLLNHNEKIKKEKNHQGLTIFIPKSNDVFEEIKAHFE